MTQIAQVSGDGEGGGDDVGRSDDNLGGGGDDHFVSVSSLVLAC